jgi:hypothetical protein
MDTSLTHPGVRATPARAKDTGTGAYLQALTWAFTFFNGIRVVAYLPTLWTIHASGDTSQHSLLTWLTFAGANATMAAWLYEQNGRRANRAIATNACNALMCGAISGLILAYRLGQFAGWMA